MENNKITVSNPVTNALDYLSVTFLRDGEGREKFPGRSAAIAEICRTLDLPDAWMERGHGGRGYARLAEHESVAELILYTLPYSPGAEHWHLEFKGKACAAVGTERIGRLAALCEGMGLVVRASRVDVAFDHCEFRPRDLRRCFVSGKTQTRIRRHSFISSNDGETFYCGSNESFRLCCYDKRGFTRAEFRVFGSKAAWFGDFILRGNYDVAASVLLHLHGNAVTFYEEDGTPLAGWLALRALGSSSPSGDRMPSRVAPSHPALSKVVAARDSLQSLLGKVAILCRGLGIPSEVVPELLERFVWDDVSLRAADKLTALVEQLPAKALPGLGT